MTTPLIVPTPGSAFSTVRYYQSLDPYYYTVDNRPLSDLDANTQAILTGPNAALFRAMALSSTNTPLGAGSLYQPGSNGYATGFNVSAPASGTVVIGQGALYLTDNVNTSIAIAVTKQFALLSPSTLALAAPSLAGQSINYLVQAKASYLDGSSMATSALPFVDYTNTGLPGLLMNGEVKVNAIAGTAAVTGSQATPSPDAGAYPLYVITVGYGWVVSVSLASGAPAMKSLKHSPVVTLPASTGLAAATQANVLGSPGFSFADGTSTSVSTLLPTTTSNLNPYAPIKFTLNLASTVASGGGVFVVQYYAVGSGDLSTASPVVLTKDTFTMSSTANAITPFTTVNGVIPNTAFAGLDGSNVWNINKQKIFVQISRVGADSLDTNTGVISLIDVTAFQ